nr:hypothetical protein [Nocardia transvalensis]
MRELAPQGWRRVEAWFAMTVVAESAQILCDDGIRPTRHPVSDVVWDAVRRHRRITAESASGPWWRLLVRIDADGVEIVADRGAEPFPGEQLFAPEAYLADLEQYPRGRLPVWLAAYLRQGERRSRTPRMAAEQVRADQRAGVRAVVVEGELPDLAVLWARWAVLSAAFVAVGSRRGPRVGPSVGLFESAGHSGSTVTVLPRGRAVLSGGVWDAPALDAAYNAGAAMPEFFAGAPDWVVDPVLNPRVATGLLSFCYWWEAGQWYRGASPPVPECAPALPAVWTVGGVAEVVGGLLEEDRSDETAEAVELLIAAAQGRTVTRADLVRVFGDDERADIDGALFQFAVADLTGHDADRLGETDALDLVRDHIRQRGYDTTGYPLSSLRADRIGTGWMVRSPVPAGEVALDRAVFYVADDGVVERSTSSVPLSVFVGDFERRFRLRRGGRV